MGLFAVHCILQNRQSLQYLIVYPDLTQVSDFSLTKVVCKSSGLVSICFVHSVYCIVDLNTDNNRTEYTYV